MFRSARFGPWIVCVGRDFERQRKEAQDEAQVVVLDAEVNPMLFETEPRLENDPWKLC